jgi:hypothetical protein
MSARRILSALLIVLAACQRDGPMDLPPAGTLSLRSVEPAAVKPGELLRLRGGGFSADPALDVVLIDGVRARVRTASEFALEVEVPSCLPSRQASVLVGVGDSRSSLLPLEVLAGGPAATSLGVAGDRTVRVTDGSECLKLAGGARYLVLVQSAGSVGGARFGFSLRGLSSGAQASAELGVGPVTAFLGEDAELGWERVLRAREEEALSSLRSRESVPATTAVGARRSMVVPAVGDERTFQVPTIDGRFSPVRAVARLVTERAVFFQDLEAPAGGLRDEELGALARDFDDPVIGLVTGTFGAASDIDGNGRVIVLSTPAVNRLTPRGSSGFVGGFFFGVDLLSEAASGNAGEILYTLVPDPEGVHSDPRSAGLVRAALPSILAHELQHLVHFNQRMRVRAAARSEALWLSEALAQSAEVLVADSLAARGRTADATLYRNPTLTRARQYLAAPGEVSLLGSAGEGTIAERGAGWLFLRYLQAQHGGTELLRALTWSTRTGQENVEAATARAWMDVFSDWSVAVFTDGLMGFGGGRLHYPDLELRALLSSEQSPFPLVPRVWSGEMVLTGERIAGSTEYYVWDARGAAMVALQLAGVSGGTPAPEARLILRVVRIE